jgi:DNA-binding HxlR family transcriptional regulator
MTEKIKKETVKELATEIDVLDHMLTSLVEVLEEKGIMTQEEWETKIKAKIEKVAKNYRELDT